MALDYANDRWRQWASYWPFLVLIPLVTIWSAAFSDWRPDDAYIYARYIENFVHGHGLTYNPGESFCGATSMVHLLISAGLALVNRDILGNQAVLHGLFHALTCATMYFVMRDLVGVPFAWLGAFLLAISQPFYDNVGMETTLFIWLLSLSMWFLMNRLYHALFALLALMFFVRGETVFWGAICGLYVLIFDRRVLRWHHFLLPTLLGLIAFGLMRVYYGEFLPASFSAKVAQGQSGYWGTTRFLDPQFLYWRLFDNPFLLSFGGGLSVVGLLEIKRRPVMGLLLMFALAHFAFFAGLNIPCYEWYLPVYQLLWRALFVLGVAWSWRALKRPWFAGRRFVQKGLACCLGLIVAGTLLIHGTQFRKADMFPQILVWVEHDRYEPIGRWLNEHSDEGTQIACVEIGRIGWYSKRPLVDILGLVSPHNAEFVGQREMGRWLEYYDPDLVLVHEPPMAFEKPVLDLVGVRFQVVNEFPFTGFQLLKRFEIEPESD